jgi:hypothetical protein
MLKKSFIKLVDPYFQMIPTTRKWDKITNELHKITKVKVLPSRWKNVQKQVEQP